jgi:threonine dehydrogenase-like Zn-dependent dehydrogenase
LARAAELFTPAYAEERGVRLVYLLAPSIGELMAASGGEGYDDVFVFAPVESLAEQGGALLAHDGCLNFFAGPVDPSFSARLNLYNCHYSAHHIACNSGGNTSDLREALDMLAAGKLDPSPMVTHIGGLDAVIDTTLNLPALPGGKKLIYTHLSMPLTPVEGIWSAEREERLLKGDVNALKG